MKSSSKEKKAFIQPRIVVVPKVEEYQSSEGTQRISVDTDDTSPAESSSRQRKMRRGEEEEEKKTLRKYASHYRRHRCSYQIRISDTSHPFLCVP